MPQIIPSFIKKTAMERCTFLALAMIPSLPNIQENHIFLKHGSPAEVDLIAVHIWLRLYVGSFCVLCVSCRLCNDRQHNSC
ncbi:hypothetical protein MIMGU_mgv1a017333mg [Erythranthe guttata]|uniref:Uncharacterized protein n=1 Tax=Erythranthe guttata TaxID=4155 RepID=A0A022R9T9_ERYGU|nr:hypothetical protein MIMGU_mgv1a017333mg [Erythranthe guttata]